MRAQALWVVLMLGTVGCASTKKPVQVPIEETSTLAQNSGPVEKEAPAQADGVPTDADLRTLYFEYNSAEIGSGYSEKVAQLASKLSAQPGTSVLVEGHCDERGSSEFNLALGERRAMAVKNHLKRFGIKGQQIKIISYGEERPAVSGNDERAWSQNRRAELVVE